MAIEQGTPDGGPTLPPVVLPSDAEVARSQASSPVLLELVGLLSQVATEATGQRGDTDSHLVLWASAAGLLDSSRGHLVLTAKGEQFAAHPVSRFEDVADVVRVEGALTLRARAVGKRPDETERLVDGKTVSLLAVLYSARGALPIQELARIACGAGGVGDRGPARSERDFHLILPYVGSLLDALAYAGLVAWQERRTVPAASDGVLRNDGIVALTSAGMNTTRRWLIEEGYSAPVVPTMTGASAIELLTSFAEISPLTFERYASAWMASRSEERAVAQLVEAIRTLDDPGLRALAAAMLAEVGLDVAEPAIRQLASDPGTRALAEAWLVEHEFEDSVGLYCDGDLDFFIDVLAVQLVGNPNDSFLDTFTLVGGHREQIELLSRIAANGGSNDLLVLGGVAQLHPSRAVAKVAMQAMRERRRRDKSSGS